MFPSSPQEKSDDENLGVAFDCLKTAWSVEGTVEDGDKLLKLYNGDGGGAEKVVDEKLQAWLDKIASKGYFDGCEKGSDDYKTRYQKAVDKYNAKVGKAAAKAAPAPAAPVDNRTEEERVAEGDALKAKGNEAFKAGRNEEAVDFYEQVCGDLPPPSLPLHTHAVRSLVPIVTVRDISLSTSFPSIPNHAPASSVNYKQAIKACPSGPNTHVFHCNKAAALQKTKQFDLAVEECDKAIKLNAKYTKAFSRKGAAQYELRQFDQAADSYRHVLELEPNNDSAMTQLKLCEGKTAAASAATAGGAGGAPAGMPDLSALAGMMGGMGGGAGGPGGGGIAAHMQLK
jgi:small glutamine-rich tetratricopeptide repeat-containing protein alpha